MKGGREAGVDETVSKAIDENKCAPPHSIIAIDVEIMLIVATTFSDHYPSTSSLLRSIQPLWNVKRPSFLTSVNVDFPISPYMGM